MHNFSYSFKFKFIISDIDIIYIVNQAQIITSLKYVAIKFLYNSSIII